MGKFINYTKIFAALIEIINIIIRDMSSLALLVWRWPDLGFIDRKAVGRLVCRHVNTMTCEIKLTLADRLSLASKMISQVQIAQEAKWRYLIREVPMITHWDLIDIFLRELIGFFYWLRISWDTQLEIVYFISMRYHSELQF